MITTNETPITVARLQEMLEAISGSNAISLVIDTVPNMRKRGNPHIGLVRKISDFHGLIGPYYKNVVSNQRRREGHSNPNFIPQQRKWGVRIVGTPLVEHNGNLYLEIKAQGRHSTKFVDLNGREVPYSSLAPYLVRPVQARTQETHKPIIWRDVKLENIRYLRMDGQVFEIIP